MSSVPAALAPPLAEEATAQPATEPRQLGLVARIALLVVVAAGLVVAGASGFALLWFVPYAGVGALLAVRRPRTSIGWLLLGLAFCQLTLTGPPIDATVASFGAGTLPLATKVYAVVWASSGPLAFVLYTILAMVLPVGRMPRGPWGRIGRGAMVAGAGLVILTAIQPTIGVNLGPPTSTKVVNPFAVLPDLALWRVVDFDLLFFPWFGVLAAAVIALVVRARRATGIERQQLRWIGTSLAILVIGVSSGFVISALVPGSSESVAWVPAIIAFPTVPLAIGVAVLRYRLYEIDTIINRAIVYGLLTAIVAGASAAAIVLSQRLFAGVLGAASDLSIVFITLAAVAALNPIKVRLQAIVDRRFKEVRDPGKELGSFLAGVHGSLSRPDRDRTLQRFLEAAVLAFGASGGEITLRAGGRERAFHAAGPSDASTRRDDAELETAPAPLRASAAAGNLNGEVSLSGGDWSRGADALGPAFAGVLGELATTPGHVSPA
ncbi:MAG TPA: hypothetical protein VEX41_02300 [Candidatus Eisenbacteria bacterium]|nr:hypothetical protein [Candidatus Eisenbacteria bacterium]